MLVFRIFKVNLKESEMMFSMSYIVLGITEISGEICNPRYLLGRPDIGNQSRARKNLQRVSMIPEINALRGRVD